MSDDQALSGPADGAQQAPLGGRLQVYGRLVQDQDLAVAVGEQDAERQGPPGLPRRRTPADARPCR